MVTNTFLTSWVTRKCHKCPLIGFSGALQYRLAEMGHDVGNVPKSTKFKLAVFLWAKFNNG
jgi:hypothetical protein